LELDKFLAMIQISKNFSQRKTFFHRRKPDDSIFGKILFIFLFVRLLDNFRYLRKNFLDRFLGSRCRLPPNVHLFENFALFWDFWIIWVMLSGKWNISLSTSHSWKFQVFSQVAIFNREIWIFNYGPFNMRSSARVNWEYGNFFYKSVFFDNLIFSANLFFCWKFIFFLQICFLFWNFFFLQICFFVWKFVFLCKSVFFYLIFSEIFFLQICFLNTWFFLKFFFSANLFFEYLIFLKICFFCKSVFCWKFDFSAKLFLKICFFCNLSFPNIRVFKFDFLMFEKITFSKFVFFRTDFYFGNVLIFVDFCKTISNFPKTVILKLCNWFHLSNNVLQILEFTN